ncbi:MAG: hypothetical protein IKC87_07820 [Clostridia bacterium]|nr:hypothetical protein [Clostridia bacterium]
MKKLTSILLVALMLVGIVMSAASCSAPSKPLPVVCGESGMNTDCGIATYGIDYYALGVAAGNMAADILIDGKAASTIPVGGEADPALIVNQAVADEIGFTIPQSVLDKAGSKSDTRVTRNTAAIVSSGADYTVGILQLTQHDALDQSNEGFKDQLSVRVAAANKTISFDDQNASGDESNNVTIAESFVAKNVDLIYTIATSSSQAAVTAASETDIPVIFNAVTDPVGAGLVESLTAPGKNVTGISDINPVEKQLDLIAELLGKDDVKIGFLYTAAETNSVYQVRTLGIPHCNSKGYTYVEKGISDINDLEAAITALKNAGVDAIYIPTDNVLANGCATVHTINTGK